MESFKLVYKFNFLKVFKNKFIFFAGLTSVLLIPTLAGIFMYLGNNIYSDIVNSILTFVISSIIILGLFNIIYFSDILYSEISDGIFGLEKRKGISSKNKYWIKILVNKTYNTLFIFISIILFLIITSAYKNTQKYIIYTQFLPAAFSLFILDYIITAIILITFLLFSNKNMLIINSAILVTFACTPLLATAHTLGTSGQTKIDDSKYYINYWAYNEMIKLKEKYPEGIVDTLYKELNMFKEYTTKNKNIWEQECTTSSLEPDKDKNIKGMNCYIQQSTPTLAVITGDLINTKEYIESLMQDLFEIYKNKTETPIYNYEDIEETINEINITEEFKSTFIYSFYIILNSQFNNFNNKDLYWTTYNEMEGRNEFKYDYNVINNTLKLSLNSLKIYNKENNTNFKVKELKEINYIVKKYLSVFQYNFFVRNPLSASGLIEIASVLEIVGEMNKIKQDYFDMVVNNNDVYLGLKIYYSTLLTILNESLYQSYVNMDVIDYSEYLNSLEFNLITNLNPYAILYNYIFYPYVSKTSIDKVLMSSNFWISTNPKIYFQIELTTVKNSTYSGGYLNDGDIKNKNYDFSMKTVNYVYIHYLTFILLLSLILWISFNKYKKI